MSNSNYEVFDLEEWLPLIDFNQEERSEFINDQLLGSMLSEDYAANITVERKIVLVKRDLQIVRRLKKRYNCKCQICGNNFLMDNGQYYCEAHHIVPVADDGDQTPENVLILCANHHRMFHYAADSITIGAIVRGQREIRIGENTYTVRYKLR